MNSSLRSLCYLLVVAAAFVAAPLRASSPVVWTFEVPATTSSSTSSSLQSITSDAVGDSFVVIALQNTSNVSGFPMTFPVGSQLFLLNPKGKIVGAAEVMSSSLVPLYVSAKRVVVADGSTLRQFTVGPNGTLVVSTLSTQVPGEALVPSEPANQDFKYLHTTLSSNNFVSTIKRYLVTKLAP